MPFAWSRSGRLGVKAEIKEGGKYEGNFPHACPQRRRLSYCLRASMVRAFEAHLHINPPPLVVTSERGGSKPAGKHILKVTWAFSIPPMRTCVPV